MLFMAHDIPRNAVIDAIEKSIANAANVLSDEQKMMLRHVGATEHYLLRGNWRMTVPDIGVCGCPLTQAGIVHPDSDNLPDVDESEFYGPFWASFDNLTRPYAGGSPFKPDVLRIRD